ncbi:hypothetical protein FACS189473_2220 [Spirochaetia bacterium]|nr:hypothetical protein FACS189473_2220 [Spirochaetia bacterium]
MMPDKGWTERMDKIIMKFGAHPANPVPSSAFESDNPDFAPEKDVRPYDPGEAQKSGEKPQGNDGPGIVDQKSHVALKASPIDKKRDKKEKTMIDARLVERLKTFIKERYVLRGEYLPDNEYGSVLSGSQRQGMMPSLGKVSDDMKQYIKKRRSPQTFTVLLEKLREEKGLTPAQLYEGAWIDRRLYSKIMGNRHSRPEKNNVLAFGLSLKLSRTEMDELLDSAGFTLTSNSIFDLAVMFCLEYQIYDIFDVNALLVAVDQKVLRRE